MLVPWLLPVVVMTAGVQDSPWPRIDAAEAAGVERVLNGPWRAFSVSKSLHGTAFSTMLGLDGALEGVERREVSGAAGVFTWLPGGKLALHLLIGSNSAYAGYLRPCKYSRDLLANDRVGLPNKTAGAVTASEAERTCYVVTIGNPAAPGSLKRMWIDQGTGVVLRRSDGTANLPDYEYKLTKFTPGSAPGAAAFQAPKGSLVLRGLVHPDLLRVELKKPGEADLDADLATSRAKSQLANGRWILGLPKPEGFEYANTFFDERVSFARRDPAAARQQANARGGVPGLPPGATSTIVRDGQNLAFSLTLPQGNQGGQSVERAVTIITATPPAGGQGGNSGDNVVRIALAPPGGDGAPINFTARVNPDGSVTFGDGGGPARSAAELAGRGAMAQSDFIDRKTGDTVSFIQLRNRPVASLPAYPLLGEPTKQKDDKLGQVAIYRVDKPYRLWVVAWKTAEGEYAVASTRLGFDDLISLAKRAK